jgi:hypothetical protein
LISTVTITSQETIITKTGRVNIKSKGVSRVAGSNGSTTHKTEKELPIGTTLQPRSSTKALQQKLSSHAKHSADAQNREDRKLAGAVLTNSRDARMPDSVAVPFQGWTVGAARRVTSAAVDNQVVKACPVVEEDSAAVPVAAVADSAAVVAVAAVAADAAVEGGRHVKI